MAAPYFANLIQGMAARGPLWRRKPNQKEGMRAIATFVERDFGKIIGQQNRDGDRAQRPLKPFGQLRPSLGIVRFLRMLRLLEFGGLARDLKRPAALM